MQITLNNEQALQLKRLLAQALATSDVGATLVDRLGYDEMGELIAIAKKCGWDEASLDAQAKVDQA